MLSGGLLTSAQAVRPLSPVDELKRPDKTELTDAFSNISVPGKETRTVEVVQ